MKPVIAVSAQTAVSETKYYGEQRLTSLYDLYVRAITDAGGLPVVLAHGDPADAPALLDRVDALLLPGGGDIDPATYGEEPSADNLYGMRPDSDRFELALVHEAAARELPVLGICRGLQLVNVAFGGTLHQDLPDHPQDVVGRAFAGHYRTSITAGSRLHEIVGTDELVVNSLHHQGIDALGTGLRIAACAGDGVVESIESTSEIWEMVAVQWHPECLRTEQSKALFAWLAEAALRRATRVDVHLAFGSKTVVPIVEDVGAAAS